MDNPLQSSKLSIERSSITPPASPSGYLPESPSGYLPASPSGYLPASPSAYSPSQIKYNTPIVIGHLDYIPTDPLNKFFYVYKKILVDCFKRIYIYRGEPTPSESKITQNVNSAVSNFISIYEQKYNKKNPKELQSFLIELADIVFNKGIQNSEKHCFLQFRNNGNIYLNCYYNMFILDEKMSDGFKSKIFGVIGGKKTKRKRTKKRKTRSNKRRHK